MEIFEIDAVLIILHNQDRMIEFDAILHEACRNLAKYEDWISNWYWLISQISYYIGASLPLCLPFSYYI